MDCTEFLAGYSDYDDSLLTPAAEAAFRAHLGACEACARYDRVLRKGRMLARQSMPSASGDFLPRLHDRLLTNPRPVPVAAAPAVAGGFLTLMVAAVTGLWLFEGGDAEDGTLPFGARARAESPALVAANRPLRLPATAQVGPPDWTAARVDRTGSSSYSPLVIGPPAYGGNRSVSTGVASTTSRTLD